MKMFAAAAAAAGDAVAAAAAAAHLRIPIDTAGEVHAAAIIC